MCYIFKNFILYLIRAFQASNLIKIHNNGFLSAAAEYIEKFPYTFIEKTKRERDPTCHDDDDTTCRAPIFPI